MAYFKRMPLTTTIIRWFTLGLNILFMFTGVLLIALGASALGDVVPGLSSKNFAAGVVVLGVFVFFVSFFGCWGSLRGNRICLIIYFGFILLFILIEFCVGIAAYANRDNIQALADSQWTSFYATDRPAIEDIENLFICCGFYNSTDRAVPPLYPGDPETCDAILGYTLPCYSGVLNSLDTGMVAAGGAAIGIAVIQFLCLGFSCYLFVKMPKYRDDDVLLDEATR